MNKYFTHIALCILAVTCGAFLYGSYRAGGIFSGQDMAIGASISDLTRYMTGSTSMKVINDNFDNLNADISTLTSGKIGLSDLTDANIPDNLTITNTPGYITAGQVPANETDAAHDTCAEIGGCVVGAITDGNTGWDNSYGYITSSSLTPYIPFTSYYGTTTLPASVATTTSRNGINITKGCYAINNVCISGGGTGSGTVNSGTQGQVSWYAGNGTAVSGTSTLFIDSTTGNVAIKGTPGAYKFQVFGNAYITKSLSTTGVTNSGLFSNTGYLQQDGGTALTNVALFVGGATTGGIVASTYLNSSFTPTMKGMSLADVFLSPVLTEYSSGGHPLLAGLAIDTPSITGAAATASNTAALYIEGAGNATVTGGNYALWSDSGENRFDGKTTMGLASSTGFSATNIWGDLTGTSSVTLKFNGISKGTMTDGRLCTYSTAGRLINCDTTPGASTAGGADTQVQFNDGGTTLGGDAGMTYNKTADRLTVTQASSTKQTITTLWSTTANLTNIVGSLTGDVTGTSSNATQFAFVNKGTMTDGKYCTYTAAGRLLACNSDVVASSDSTWTLHNSYPAACGAGTFATTIGDTLTCAAPGNGSDTQVIFNDGGTAYGGDAGMVYSKTPDRLTVTKASTTLVTVSTSFQLPTSAAPIIGTAGLISFDTTKNQLLVATSTNNFPAVYPYEKPICYTASTSAALTQGTTTLGAMPFGFRVYKVSGRVLSGTSIKVKLHDGTNLMAPASLTATRASSTPSITNAIWNPWEEIQLSWNTVSGAVWGFNFCAYITPERE